jgi:YegS/Rv2252/BmrU family lipid kinase
LKRAALIYNPVSGRRRHLRLEHVESAAGVLQAAGVEVRLVPTESSGSAGAQTHALAAEGFDTIFACGGDGTMHDVLQGLIGTEAALGIIPLGSGNVLAHDLGMPIDPAAAARAQLEWEPRKICAGKLECVGPENAPTVRYFATTAGIGWDAEMLYRVTVESKSKLGLLAYVYEGSKLALMYGFPPFDAEYTDGNGQREKLTISQVMAVRITDFGSFMRRFAPGAALTRDDMQLVMFRTRRLWRYVSYMVGVSLGMNWPVGGVDLVHAKEIRCEPIPGHSVHRGRHIAVEADGEVIGTLPAKIEIVPEAFRLLMPKSSSQQPVVSSRKKD